MPGKNRDLDDARRIGERLRLYRQLSSLTQTEAASRIGVTKEHVSVLERGHCYPSLEVLSRAAKAYGTGLANFLLFSPVDKPHHEHHPADLLPQNVRLVRACGIWTMNFAANSDTWSRELCRLLGLPPRTKPSPDKFLERIHLEDQTGVKRFLYKVQARQRPAPLPCKALRKDGIIRHLLIQADQLEDESESQDMARLLVLDVTDWSQFRDHLIRDMDRLEDIIEERTNDLRQSETMFQAVAEDTPALTCRYAPGCIITYVNEAYCRFFGKSRSELEGTSFLDLMPKADQAPFLAALAGLTPKNPTIRTEHQILDLQGKTRWQRWTDRAIFDAQGRVVAYQGIGEDITEQKQTQEALRASEELYRSIYTRSPIAIELYDSSGRLLEVNPVCLELFGVQDVQELQGFDLFTDPNLQPHDIEKLRQGETVRFETVFDFGKVKHHNLYRTSKTGTIWLRVLITPLGEAGAHGYLAQVQDITEHKKAQENLLEQRSRLVNILKGTNVGTWEWNVQTGETAFNERWAEIVGYDLEELAPISITTWMGLAHPEDLRTSEELLQQHFRGEIDFYECEARMRHKNGHWVWVLDRGRVITWTEDGKPLWMFGTHQDITQRKLAGAGDPDHR
ncbi:PAS domain S-box protein [Desulfonatronum thioautotrophicum]|uniref:PAS domain S-box protein n=1 Tax=Desulfonatronum thioautotrophicum TaxID=617001 RepID=UPI0005EAF61E|nr:PAS domain S-box protein [Desulfonatronum thioautotrophicum]